MYTPDTYIGRQRAMFKEAAEKHSQLLVKPIAKKDRVMDELKTLGMSKWGLMLSASRYLHRIIHQEEHLGAVVYGRHTEGMALLVATNRNVVFLNKKPMYIKSDELTYDIVSGVKYGQAGIFATVTLHTRIADYAIKTMNLKCAMHFRDFIEAHCLEYASASYDVW